MHTGDPAGHPSPTMTDDAFTRIAKALADPRRFEILEVISQTGELSCGDIAARFPISQSTVSHHLRLLAEAGLIEVRREGQHGFFSARPEVLDVFTRILRERLAPRSGGGGAAEKTGAVSRRGAVDGTRDHTR